jgi:threonine dehydratase
MKNLIEAIRPTTFIESKSLSKLFGVDFTIAAETFQHTGSFKFRAAYNVALNVPNSHIITASSGNFGQALALACQILNKKCTVVMPDTSAKVKIEGVKSFDATVDLVITRKIGRAERVNQLIEENAEAYRASAFDDLLVIEGNATLGDEIAKNKKHFDFIVSPIGGGGLVSGIITGLRRHGINTAVLGAEPLLANDAARSLKARKIIHNEYEPQTIADGARTLSLGKHNWEIIKNGVNEIIEVSEEKIKEAVKILFTYANLKVEPTAALSLGAVMESPDKFIGKKVCLVISGGNVDMEVYKRILDS